MGVCNMYKKDMIEDLMAIQGNHPVFCITPGRDLYQISSLNIVKDNDKTVAILAYIKRDGEQDDGHESDEPEYFVFQG